MKKVFYFDCETTGTDPVLNGLYELACIVEIDGEVKEEKIFQMRPFGLAGCPNSHLGTADVIEVKALEVGYLSVKDLETYPYPKKTFGELIAFLDKYIDKFNKADKFIPAGFNVHFDMEFLNKWFIKNGDSYMGSYLNWRAMVDPLPVIRFLEYLDYIDIKPDHRLGTVCKYFDIPLEEAHRAINDIRATREVIKKASMLINNQVVYGS
jgi:DNA polymerase-3 subunit epsilon